MSQVIINGQAYEQNPDGSLTPVKPASPGLGSIAQPLVNEGIHQGISALSTPAAGAPATPNVLSINGAAPVEAASSWTTAPANGSLGQIAGAIAAIHGGYGAFNNWQNGHSGRGDLTEAGAGIGSMVGGPVGGAIGAGFGNIMGYGMQGTGWKNHLALLATSPVQGLARLAGFDLMHKTTKQYEAERWKALADKAPTDKVWQQNLSNLANAAHPAGDTGQKWTPEVAAIAMKDPAAMWGHQGMLNTFGSDYFNKMSEYQRWAATKYAIDNGLLKGDHGDIIVTDPDKLKGALNDFTGNKDYKAAFNAWIKAGRKLPDISGASPAASPPPVTGTTPATAKIDLSALMPKGDSRADKWNKVQSVLGQADPKSFQKLKVGSSLRGLMPENFGSY